MEIRINRKDLLNNYYRLLLTPPSNTNNQQLISRRLSFRRGLHTSLGLLLLCCCRCQNLTTIWNHNSINSATFYWMRYPGSLGPTFDVSHGSRLQHLSSKFALKIKPPFSFDGKFITTTNVIELAFYMTFHPSLCSTVYWITRSYFVTQWILDDLE
jgi:hypothetical protein